MKDKIYLRAWTSDQDYEDFTSDDCSLFNKNSKFHETIFHRTNKPAIEYISGSKEWWIDGKRHRMDGPAIEQMYGYRAWYQNGQRHRTDGPAIIHMGGGEEWWVNGRLLPRKYVKKWIKENSINLSSKEDQLAFLLRFS